jgi:hypothetical protein
LPRADWRAVSTETLTAGAPNGIDWRRAEFVLTLAAFLCFALIPIHLTTIYSGLPAHPLFLHVPVMLIPIAVLAAIACAIRPAWLHRYGIALAALAVVAMGTLFLTMGAGSALRDALHLGGGGAGAFGANSPAGLIARHSHAAGTLRLLTIAFTAVLILAFAAQRISGGMPTGAGVVDRLLAPRSTVVSLRVLLVVLSIACGYSVFKTGDLGAKAVWAGRLSGGAGGFGPGGAPGIRPAGPVQSSGGGSASP